MNRNFFGAHKINPRELRILFHQQLVISLWAREGTFFNSYQVSTSGTVNFDLY